MAKNNGSKSVAVCPVVVGQVVEGTVAKLLLKQGTDERIGALVDVGNGKWERVRVAELGSVKREERDGMLAAMKVGDKVTVKVMEIKPDGQRTLIELSAKQVVIEARQAALREQKEAVAARQAAGEAALALLVQGFLITGTVKSVVDFGVFVTLDEFHTGLLHKDEQLNQQQRPKDLQVGDKVEVLVKSVGEPAGRNTRVSLSEKAAVAERAKLAEAEKAQAKTAAGVKLRGELEVGKTYKAVTVSDEVTGLTVAIDGLVPAKLANADMLGAVVEGDKVTVKNRGSFQSKGQPLSVEVVSLDGDTVVVKQTSKKKQAKS